MKLSRWVKEVSISPTGVRVPWGLSHQEPQVSVSRTTVEAVSGSCADI